MRISYAGKRSMRIRTIRSIRYVVIGRRLRRIIYGAPAPCRISGYETGIFSRFNDDLYDGSDRIGNLWKLSPAAPSLHIFARKRDPIISVAREPSSLGATSPPANISRAFGRARSVASRRQDRDRSRRDDLTADALIYDSGMFTTPL